MKKNKCLLIKFIVLCIMFSSLFQAEAALQNLGTDSLGNRLIYDNDRNLTWYDFSNSDNTWANQVAWADALSVTFGSIVYSDWRLPVDGTLCKDHYCTDSEFGHLFYTELGNVARVDMDGDPTGCGGLAQPSCLASTGPFQNFTEDGYWLGTDLFLAVALHFNTVNGFQGDRVEALPFSAMAVRQGMAVVPEPVSVVLFLVGLGVICMRRYIRSE